MPKDTKSQLGFVPLSFIAELLGENVRRESADSAASKAENVEPVYLSDLKAHTSTDLIEYDADAYMKMGGQTYHRGVKMAVSSIYSAAIFDFDLKGRYSRLTGSLGIDDESYSGAQITVEFIGDGESLGGLILTSEQLPRPVSIDVRGVGRLTIRLVLVRGLYSYYVDLADAVLQ